MKTSVFLFLLWLLAQGSSAETKEQLKMVMRGIWEPPKPSGEQTLTLFCVKCCSSALDAHLKNKSTIHTYGYIIFWCQSLKCVSVSRCPGSRIRMQWYRLMHKQSTRIHTIDQPQLISFCLLSSTHQSSSDVSLMSETFWKHSVMPSLSHTRLSPAYTNQIIKTCPCSEIVTCIKTQAAGARNHKHAKHHLTSRACCFLTRRWLRSCQTL